MVYGNTFGSTALTSYGRFWISLAIIMTPARFRIQASYDSSGHSSHAFGRMVPLGIARPFLFIACPSRTFHLSTLIPSPLRLVYIHPPDEALTLRCTANFFYLLHAALSSPLYFPMSLLSHTFMRSAERGQYLVRRLWGVGVGG